jgi:WD40 repeat protein
VKVFEVASGKELVRLPHENVVVYAIAFSPDGRYLATGGGDPTGISAGTSGIARVFEAESGKEIARLPHDDLVYSVVFSPDGRYLDTVLVPSGSEYVGESILRRHLLQSHDLITEICARLTRNLTYEEWNQYVGDTPYQKTCPRLPCPSNIKTDAKGYCVAQEK